MFSEGKCTKTCNYHSPPQPMWDLTALLRSTASVVSKQMQQRGIIRQKGEVKQSTKGRGGSSTSTLGKQ